MREELHAVELSAASAKDEATHSEAKQEGKYDTRAIQASYLAGAQEERAKILKFNILQIENLSKGSYTPTKDVVSAASVVTLEANNANKKYFILLPCTPGLEIEIDGLVFTTLTPQSSLGAKIHKKEIGESLTHSGNEYTVVEIF